MEEVESLCAADEEHEMRSHREDRLHNSVRALNTTKVDRIVYFICVCVCVCNKVLLKYKGDRESF